MRTLIARSLAVLCVLLLASACALANVYATRLEAGGQADGVIDVAGGGSITLSFILNEAADNGVTLEICRASDNAVIRSVSLGPLGKGSHQWVWDGKDGGGTTVPAGTSYYFKVTAADDGHAAWDQLSDDTNWQNTFYHARDVEVNRDPTSKYFGRVYVSQGIYGACAANGRITGNGFFALNADCSDAVGQGDIAKRGGVNWDFHASNPSYDTGYAPNKIAIGADGRLYACNQWDGYSSLWILDGDLAYDAVCVLEPPAWPDPQVVPSGLTDNHGSPCAVWPEGKGHDLKLYTLDEEYRHTGYRGAIWRYEVGSSGFPCRNKPFLHFDEYTVGANRVQNYENQLVRDAEGNWYITQYRYDGTDLPSLIKVNPDCSAIVWNSLVESRNLLGPTAADLLRCARGIAIDDARSRIAVATRLAGDVLILGKDLNLAAITNIPMGGTINLDCAFDAVGNVYAVNTSAEYMRIFSPPDGPNQYTTRQPGLILATSGDTSAPPAPVVTDDGDMQTSLTTLNATWTTVSDPESGIARYEYAVGYAPYDFGDYIVGWTPAGLSTAVNLTGLDLHSGWTYYMLVRAVNGQGIAGPAGVADGIKVIGGSKIGAAKKLSDGTQVALVDVVVTGDYTEYLSPDASFYVEEQDRSAGIKCVHVGSEAPTTDHVVDIIGRVKAAPDAFLTEMYFEVEQITDKGAPSPALQPLALNCNAVGGGAFGGQAGVTGGIGANTVGLKVAVWGAASVLNYDADISRDYFTVTDGSPRSVRCILESGADPAPTAGRYVRVVGVSTVKKESDGAGGFNYEPLVLLKGASWDYLD